MSAQHKQRTNRLVATFYRPLIMSQFLQRYSIIVLLLLIVFSLSYTAFTGIDYYESQYSQQQFQAKFKGKVTSLSQAASAINKVFLATKAVLDINHELTQAEFAKLITNDFLLNTGMQGIEWAPSIAYKDISSFENKVRASGVFDFQIRNIPTTTNASCNNSKTKNIFPVLFAEPADIIGHELGLKINSDCSLAEKMNQALLSENIASVNFTNKQGEFGLRLLQPVFTTTNKDSPKVLIGYIIGIVMLNELVDSLWGDLTNLKENQLLIYINDNKKQKIYDSRWREECGFDCPPAPSFLSLKTKIPFANQLWIIEFSKLTEETYRQYYSYAVALFILLLSLSISAYLWTSINRVNWAKKLVQQRTESLQHQAIHDDLTQLLNKQSLSDVLEKITKQQSRITDEGVALLFIDLDHFKKVNDTQGHLVGDMLLKQVAQRLTYAARSDDLIFRFGGDEFAVILHKTNDKKTIISISNRILKSLEQVYLIENKKYRIGASIGVSLWNPIKDKNISSNELIRNADIAMYEAKTQGRGRVVFYHEKMHEQLLYKHDVEDELSAAIKNNQLSLFLQPIHDVNHLIGFEALSRWQHPDKGMIYPDIFIEIAEKTGLIHNLGYWLIMATCQQLALFIEQFGVDNCPYISINVSPIQLDQGEVVQQIEQALKQYNVPSKLLAVELTESALINKKSTVKQCLSRLQYLGVQIFLDDFGTGYSSLSLLQDFTIDVLKIDKSFIVGLESNNKKSQQLVKAIINMAHALNMKVVAEGVENENTLCWLQNENCHFMQGYYLSKPLSPEKLPRYLTKYLPIRKPLSMVANDLATKAATKGQATFSH
jgi:diguanylate cyclase (GGDEF)-like protein